MGVLASDNFNRANANPIGAPWAVIAGEQGFQISSNVATPSSLALDCDSYYNIPWPDDQYSQCKVTATGGAAADLGIGPMVRAASGAVTFYRAVWNGAATSNITLSKAVSNSFTTLWTRSATIASGDTLRLEARGSIIRVLVNGVPVGADQIDSSIPSGFAGVNYSSQITTASLDDWEGGDFDQPSPQWIPGFMLATTGPHNTGMQLGMPGFMFQPYDAPSAGPQQFNQSLSGTLTFTSSDTFVTSHGQTATLSFTSSDAFQTSKTLPTAVLSFTSSLVAGHLFAQALSATLSFTSSQLRSVGTHLAGVLSFTSTQTRATKHTQSGSLAFTSSATRVTSKALSATLSFVSAQTRKTTHALTATLSFTGSLTTQAVHFFQQSLSASLSFTSSQSLRTVHTIAASLGFTSAQTRRTSTTRAASLSFTSSDAFRTNHAIAAALSFTSTQTRRTAHALAGSLSFTGSLTTQVVHFFTQALSATLSFTGALTSQHVIPKALSATLSFTGALTRRTGNAQAATLSFTSTQSRRVSAHLAATLSFIGNLTRIPSLLSALSDLRVRISGREPGNAVGREPPNVISGREPGGASGRESPSSVSYKRSVSSISGEEDGT